MLALRSRPPDFIDDRPIDGSITKATLTRAMPIEALTQVLRLDDTSGGAAPH